MVKFVRKFVWVLSGFKEKEDVLFELLSFVK